MVECGEEEMPMVAGEGVGLVGARVPMCMGSGVVEMISRVETMGRGGRSETSVWGRGEKGLDWQTQKGPGEEEMPTPTSIEREQCWPWGGLEA